MKERRARKQFRSTRWFRSKIFVCVTNTSLGLSLTVPWRSFRTGNIYPDENTPTTLFNGIPFNEIPIVNIKVSPNNTIMNITDAKGATQIYRSCGIEGFKNARKGTNIAAQATAISLSTKILDRGIKLVRVTVRGLGPGRMVRILIPHSFTRLSNFSLQSAIKGLQMGGLNIVSITDTTPVSWNPPRPRKAKRL